MLSKNSSVSIGTPRAARCRSWESRARSECGCGGSAAAATGWRSCRRAPGLWILEHPLDLRLQHGRLVEATLFGKLQQLVVGIELHRKNEREASSRSETGPRSGRAASRRGTGTSGSPGSAAAPARRRVEGAAFRAPPRRAPSEGRGRGGHRPPMRAPGQTVRIVPRTRKGFCADVDGRRKDPPAARCVARAGRLNGPVSVT